MAWHARPARPFPRRLHHGPPVLLVLRALLGFDETRRQQALSFCAALFVIGFVAPAPPNSSRFAQKATPCSVPILGLTARPLLESLMHLASSLRQDGLAFLRSWISRWD